jgi:lytic murein transglycosylase
MSRSSLVQVAISALAGFTLLVGMNSEVRAQTDFALWVQQFWPEAQAAGISRTTFDQVFAGMVPNCHQPDVSCPRGAPPPVTHRPSISQPHRPPPNALPSTCNKVSQKEFLQPDKYFPSAYLRRLAKEGRSVLAYLKTKEPRTYQTLLDVEANLRIPHLILMGIWGRETAFGGAALNYNAVQALSSSAYAGPRSRRKWAKKQLLAALKMIQRGDVTMAEFRTSYAGATGLTQIMPDEYLTFGVDADLDGRKDIWHSVADSVATTANVLKNRGWRSTEHNWGYEVVGRRRLDCTLEGLQNRRPIRRWVQDFGVSPVSRGAQARFPNPDNLVYLLMPAGTRGPAFLVTGNFDVLRRYNPSELYALFVGHLSDRVGCDTDQTECSFVTPWPQPGPDDFEFSVKNLCRLQVALKQGGFFEGQPDGLFGARTRVAIGRYQMSQRQAPDCYPTRTLFETLINTGFRE